MENFLGNIYSVFKSLFGDNLSDHLWGFDCASDDFTRQNQFNTIGLIALGVAIFMVIFYYYILNHTRFNTWWSWLIVLTVTAAINFFIGFWNTSIDLAKGAISDCLLYERNTDGEIINTLIFESNCWGFGVANMFVSIIFFVVLSFSFKWWSSNAKHSPFL